MGSEPGRIFCRPSGAPCSSAFHPGLAPGATVLRPAGALRQQSLRGEHVRYVYQSVRSPRPRSGRAGHQTVRSPRPRSGRAGHQTVRSPRPRPGSGRAGHQTVRSPRPRQSRTSDRALIPPRQRQPDIVATGCRSVHIHQTARTRTIQAPAGAAGHRGHRVPLGAYSPDRTHTHHPSPGRGVQTIAGGASPRWRGDRKSRYAIAPISASTVQMHALFASGLPVFLIGFPVPEPPTAPYNFSCRTARNSPAPGRRLLGCSPGCGSHPAIAGRTP
jgi:hypothetical protein